MKRIIVTGGTGFIGRALVDRLRRDLAPDAEIIALGSSALDLTDSRATFDWFEQRSRDFHCDQIFHLAALYKAGDWPVHHPATQFYANTTINTNALEAWARFCPKARWTSVLSYCVYPSHPEPHSESELWGTEPEDYLFAYAMTKKALLIGERAYRQQYGLSCTSVILPTVYGPGDSFREDSHVMGALIGKFVRATRENLEAVEIWGDGAQEREFLYVHDAVDGIIAAALRSRVDVLNLGTGEAWPIRRIAELIRRESGYQGRMQYNPAKFTGVRKRLLNVARLQKELAWRAPTALEQGIRETVRSYLASSNEIATG